MIHVYMGSSHSSEGKRHPVMARRFVNGSVLTFCSGECLQGWNVEHDDEHAAIAVVLLSETGDCLACAECGLTIRSSKDCLWHKGLCPSRQWIMSRQAMQCARVITKVDDFRLQDAWTAAERLALDEARGLPGAVIGAVVVAQMKRHYLDADAEGLFDDDE
jgi:hypothetical protein